MTLSTQLVEYVSACFTGLWIQGCEHEDVTREIAELCRDGDGEARYDIVSSNDPVDGLQLIVGHFETFADRITDRLQELDFAAKANLS